MEVKPVQAEVTITMLVYNDNGEVADTARGTVSVLEADFATRSLKEIAQIAHKDYLRQLNQGQQQSLTAPAAPRKRLKQSLNGNRPQV